MTWGPVHASCVSPGCFGSLDKTQKLLRELGHFPRVSWLLQRPVPTRLLFNIDFWKTGNLPGLQYIYPKCSKQVNNKALVNVWEYRACSIVFFILLCITECPYVPVDADLMQVGPWGVGASRDSRLMPWQDLGAGVTGASLSSQPAVQSSAWLLAPGSSLSVEVWEQVDACAWACSLCEQCWALLRVWPGV